MDTDIKNMRIEELELDGSIIKKLKEFFIYTVGDLQAKTKEDLGRIHCFDYREIDKI